MLWEPRFGPAGGFFETRKVTTNDIGQLNAHPPNRPAAVSTRDAGGAKCYRQVLSGTHGIRPWPGDPCFFHQAGEAGEQIMAIARTRRRLGMVLHRKSGAIGQFETAI